MATSMPKRVETEREFTVGSDGIMFGLTAGESEGELAVLRVTIPPSGGPPMLHRHEAFELYRLRRGELAFYLERGDGAVTRTLAGPGAVIPIRGGLEHMVRNESDEEAEATVVFTPGASMERFVRAAAKPADGATAGQARDPRRLRVLEQADIEPHQIVREHHELARVEIFDAERPQLGRDGSNTSGASNGFARRVVAEDQIDAAVVVAAAGLLGDNARRGYLHAEPGGRQAREAADRRTPLRAPLALAERAAARAGTERLPQDAQLGRVRSLASRPHGGCGRGDEGALRVRLRRLAATASDGADRLPLPRGRVAAQGDRARGSRAPPAS